MATRVESNEFKFYQRKRNLILISFLMMGILMLSSIFIPIIFPINEDILFSIYVIVLMLLAGYILMIKPYFMTYSMYYHYYRMIDDQVPAQPAKIDPSSAEFTHQLKDDGFNVILTRPNFTYYARMYNSLPWINRAATTLVIIMVYHQSTADFYSQSIDQDVQYVKSQLEGKTPILNHVMIQIKTVSALTITPTIEFNQIINYSENNRAMIQLPVAYITSTSQAYCLRPLNKYPNKYYYYAVRLMEHLLGIKKES